MLIVSVSSMPEPKTTGRGGVSDGGAGEGVEGEYVGVAVSGGPTCMRMGPAGGVDEDGRDEGASELISTGE